MSAADTTNKIKAYEPTLRRKYTPGEVEKAVARAYAQPKPESAARSASPKWPEVNPEAQEYAVKSSPYPTLTSLRAASQPFPTNPEEVAEYFVDQLFPGDPLLCFGSTADHFGTGLRSQVRGVLHEAALFVPSPMRAETGMKKDGSGFSGHTEDNTGPRTYLNCEFDGGESPDRQAAIIGHLSGFAPLVSVCHSGGKSLHALFNVGGHPEAAVLRFFTYAVVLGADSTAWGRSQFGRLPGGFNYKTEARQEAYYLNAGLAWPELPEPPAIVPGFAWNIQSGAETWTSDASQILDMSDPPLIDGIIRECEVGTVVGAAKTSKTWFTLGLGVAVATGAEFLGRKTHQAETLYLDYELKENTFRKRLCMVAPEVPKGFHYQCLRGCSQLPNIDQISALIISKGIKLLIVDSLYRTGWLTEENSNDKTSRELTRLQQLAKETNCTILVVDHTAKGGGAERSAVDASRGASTKGGFFDFIFVLRASKGQDPALTYVVLDPVLRDWPGLNNLPIISFAWEPSKCRVNLEGEVPADDPNILKSRILDHLADMESGVSFTQIKSALEVSETTLRRALKDLVDGGKVGESPDEQHKQRKLYRRLLGDDGSETPEPGNQVVGEP